MLTLDTARNALHDAGMRITPQRLMILDVLVDNRTHPTVEDIYDRVRAHYPTISLATVYHTLAMLSSQGLVLALHGGKEGLRCDPDTTPHAHAYCEVCGGVFDIPLSSETLPDGLLHLNGFAPTMTEISLHGHCAACQHNTSDDSQGMFD